MKHRLLIAISDAEWCELYRRFLTELGYEVETATNGLDCLANLRQVAPAVLVLDLELPWGGGDGVLAWLREESPALVVDYLPKPVALTPLLESVRSAVASRERRTGVVERRSRSSLHRAFHFLG